MESENNYKVGILKNNPHTATEAVDFILHTAVKMNASDIHLGFATQESPNSDFWLRFRVFGNLQVIKADFIPKVYKEVIARIKILAKLNISETYEPQDGQISITCEGKQVELRVSIIPTGRSEEAVIRIQQPTAHKYSLDEFRLTPEMRTKMEMLIEQKSGLLLVSGPTGSGKTTLVYSMLNQLARPELKILTVEDPVEMRLKYVSHTQLTPRTSFATMGRSLLRQDANVIFLGEIRDEESADSAMQLAQTGHLVISTVHTRDSVGVISRLKAINVLPNFIAASLVGSISIRLSPKLCPHCREEEVWEEKVINYVRKNIAIDENQQKLYKKGVGCEHCSGGIVGMTPLMEIFTPDVEMSDMINRNVPSLDIFKAARQKGMRTLAEDAFLAAQEGLIDLRDVVGYLAVAD